MDNFFGVLRSDYIDGEKWKITNPSGKKQFGFNSSKHKKIIPKNGFVTDYASIPSFFHAVLPPTGRGNKRRYGKSAVIHDWLYYTGQLTKKESDKVFLDCLNNSEVYSIVRIIMYQAVKFFGYFAWKRHRMREKNEV